MSQHLSFIAGETAKAKSRDDAASTAMRLCNSFDGVSGSDRDWLKSESMKIVDKQFPEAPRS